MLEGLKIGLHNNLGPSVLTGDRFHWYASTGWIMWNCQIHGLLGGTTICLFDGSPAGPAGAADWSAMWRFAAETGVTFFGAGAAFYASCLKAGVEPMRHGDLSRLRGIGATGSPLAIECYRWVWDHLPKVEGENIWLTPMSGGTDFAGAFIAGLPTLPVVEGEMQCRCLGAAVEAWNDAGQPLVDAVGELVCVKPMPSMPLFFWGDEDGTAIATATSTSIRASGAMATGSGSRRAAARSSTAAATPPSTGTASAWARPSCTARSRPCPRCSTRWSSTSNTSAAKATCRCSSSCARAWCSTRR
jgi:acyl-coenzyme A synthetase/AMP-(fatty) acid ligase